MTEQDKHETPVIFRRYGPRKGGEVIALFPAESWSSDSYTCSCYVQIGQHGAADPNHVIRSTRAAKPDEYVRLKHELESAGYRLKVYSRLQRSFLDARRRALAEMR